MLKLDVAKQECSGIVVAEVRDAGGQICDYASTKPLFQAWSTEYSKATEGKSLGSLRLQHSLRAVGKIIAVEYHDAAKEIWLAAKVIDPEVWRDVKKRWLNGFAMGGSYAAGPDSDGRYTLMPYEVSLVRLLVELPAHRAHTDSALSHRK
jgi:hypothetical protein